MFYHGEVDLRSLDLVIELGVFRLDVVSHPLLEFRKPLRDRFGLGLGDAPDDPGHEDGTGEGA
jgi:hypothetical protein